MLLLYGDCPWLLVAKETIDDEGDDADDDGDPGASPSGPCCWGDVDSDAKSEDVADRLALRKLFFLLGVSPTATVADWSPNPERLLTVLLLLLPALISASDAER